MQRIVLTLIACLVATSCRPASPPVSVYYGRVRLGVTRLDEVYGEGRRRSALALIDPQERTVYTSEPVADRVKKLFRVKEDRGAVWVIDHPQARGEYQVRPLQKLDFQRPIRAGDIVAVGDLFCRDYPKDTCIDFYEDDGSFSYSWKAVETVYLCAREPGDCVDIWQTNKVTVYAEKGCKGAATEQEEAMAFCTPP